ncbi:DNA-binding transcriptional repressor ArsR [Roseovarius aestuarii]|uniref:DNA-binding transcriptional repressor ArsR n=1 Tax=Roseovarius aestuarii TaxID=475083 RepID=A0A1X7BPC3_9RHOB|nr:DNA-binding transcriptional repressor ArsR [Roseovarius aestuarii]
MCAPKNVALRLTYNLDIEIYRYMNLEQSISSLNNPVRRRILEWLKDRSNFPPALPEHADLDGVCVGYIQEKAKLSQSTISTYMGLLREAGFVVAERHGQWTFYRRDEENIRAFLDAVESELLKP